MRRILGEFGRKTLSISAQEAESLALRAVAYIAADETRLTRLIGLAGIAPQDLRQRLDQPAFLAGILEFVLGEEAMVLDFAAEAGVPPEAVGKAHARLSGARGMGDID